MTKHLFIALCLLLSFLRTDAQPDVYRKAISELDSMLSGSKPPSFKRAVFITENAYFDNRLEYPVYEAYIKELSDLAKDWMLFNSLNGYKKADSLNITQNYAVYKVLKDTIRIFTSAKEGMAHVPYTYNFEDYSGQKDWSDIFVVKLMATHTGTCHSLPYLYKIIADDLGAKCWLGLAPNHMYIKNRCKETGWYNTELTSGDFPIDAWIMGFVYIPIQAIQNGIYMDTLSNHQAIALCALDLAKEYEHKMKNYYDGFILQCCDLSLKHFPMNVQAMLLKAETLKRIYGKEKTEMFAQAKDTYNQMEQLYTKLYGLGYREMPDKMYQNWLLSVNNEKFADQNLQKKLKTNL